LPSLFFSRFSLPVSSAVSSSPASQPYPLFSQESYYFAFAALHDPMSAQEQVAEAPAPEAQVSEAEDDEECYEEVDSAL
jgi:hypothetical protein